MGRRALDATKYDLMVELFRKHGNHPSTVARLADVDPRTALRAWESGWNRKGLRPIRLVMEEEALVARAEYQAKLRTDAAIEERRRQDAIEQAGKARAQEGQMVQLARVSALTGLSVETELVTSARRLASMVKARIERAISDWEAAVAATPPGAPDPMFPLTMSECTDMLARIALTMVRINDAARDAMDMERIHFGQPTAYLGVIPITSAKDMTPQELAARLSVVQDALADAVAGGSLQSPAPKLTVTALGKEVHDA